MSLKININSLLALILLGSACTSKTDSTAVTAKDISTDNTLTIAQAKHYVNNYSKRAGEIDSIFVNPTTHKVESKKVQDTRAVWFGIDRLKALVAKVEAEGGDGIRFYYATYDPVYEEEKGYKPPVRPYWNHNTLLMVSTKDSLGRHQDYYTDTKQNGVFHGFIITASPENRGEMCPPPSDCQGTGASLVEQYK